MCILHSVIFTDFFDTHTQVREEQTPVDYRLTSFTDHSKMPGHPFFLVHETRGRLSYWRDVCACCSPRSLCPHGAQVRSPVGTPEVALHAGHWLSNKI